MDFEFTEQEREWQERARAFADEWLRPGVLEREWVQDPEERVNWDIIEAGSSAGLRTTTVPPEYGGPDPALSSLAQCLIIEELAAGDVGMAVYFNHCMKDVAQIARLGTREQKDTFFPTFVSDHRFLTAQAATEPEHGADRYLPPDGFTFETTAVRDGDEWVLNGRKHCISASGEAKLFLVQTATAPDRHFREGSTLFMVPADAPGVSPGRVHDKVGLRTVNNGEVLFDDCRVSDDAVLGEVNKGIALIRQLINDDGVLSMAMKLGIARSAVEHATAHAKNRIQGGKPIIDHQAVGMKLAEAHVLVEAMRTLMYRWAWMNDNPEHHDRAFTESTIWWGVEATFRAVTLAFHVTGCQGSWLDDVAQKHMRDAMQYFPNDGTHTIHLLAAHQHLKAR